MPVSLWPVEGSIYPMLDAAGMRGETEVKRTFDIGEGQRASVYFRADEPFNLHKDVNPQNIKIGIRFLGKDNTPWFGMDVDKNNLKHFHLGSANQPMGEHILLSGNYTLAEFVSETFEKAKEIIIWKFPELKIVKGSDFVGFA